MGYIPAKVYCSDDAGGRQTKRSCTFHGVSFRGPGYFASEHEAGAVLADRSSIRILSRHSPALYPLNEGSLKYQISVFGAQQPLVKLAMIETDHFFR